MKLDRIILPVVACALTIGGCDDTKMEWGRPDNYGDVTISDMPLALKEKIANYDYIKSYAAQYMPNSLIGIGAGANLYIDDEAYRKVVDDNFQMITLGNAMKHSSVVKTNGDLDFTTVDNFLAAIPAEMKVYGHNLLWHTQQKQAYLKSLIAPEVVIHTDPSDNVENVIANSDFEGANTSGWGAWSSAGCTAALSEQGKGYESDYALKLYNPKAGGNYSAQAYYTLPAMDWEVGETYIVSCYVYAEVANPSFQFELQKRSGDYPGGHYLEAEIPAKQWFYFEKEFVLRQDIVDLEPSHLTIDFGSVEGVTYVDNIKFGKKKSGPTNYCTNPSFENGTTGWTLQNVGSGVEAVTLADAVDGTHVLKMTASSTSAKEYDLQVITSEMATMPGKKVQVSFYVKSDQAGEGRLSFSGLKNNYPYMPWTDPSASWTKSFTTSTSWQLISVVLQNFNDNDFAEDASTWKINFDFGFLPNVTYYIDNVQVTEYVEEAKTLKATRASGVTYKIKTPEEKKELLRGAMEAWIKGMVEHCGDRVTAWDVINEPIADNHQWRGVGGNFMSNGADADPDMEPTETEDAGLSLNWADDHFYWGYYMGKDYAVKAFEYARRYAPAGTKLFVNDYNLETSPNKLAALIELVDYIEANGQTVDGIGTQMHVKPTITRAEVDAMFKTMAQTGKLVRVTELDVALGSANPSAEELEKQADTYQLIFDSYRTNVPEAQQSGITIWTLTDDAREHEYWLPDESPNVFDKNYGRKHAYKGVCDGIAGKDISEEFSGDDWKKAY